MNIKTASIAAAFLLIGIFIGVNFHNSPGSYKTAEDCIFANIEKAKSDRAASIVYGVCKELHPKNPFDQFDNTPSPHQ